MMLFVYRVADTDGCAQLMSIVANIRGLSIVYPLKTDSRASSQDEMNFVWLLKCQHCANSGLERMV